MGCWMQGITGRRRLGTWCWRQNVGCKRWIPDAGVVQGFYLDRIQDLGWAILLPDVRNEMQDTEERKKDLMLDGEYETQDTGKRCWCWMLNIRDALYWKKYRLCLQKNMWLVDTGEGLRFARILGIGTWFIAGAAYWERMWKQIKEMQNAKGLIQSLGNGKIMVIQCTALSWRCSRGTRIFKMLLDKYKRVIQEATERWKMLAIV